jgi:tetratricopeptide (TPR) repeat protein
MSRRPPVTYRIRKFFDRLGERVAGLGRAIVSPFDRASSAIGRTFIAGTERLDRADSLLASLVRLLTWPVRVLGRGLAALGGVLLPRSVRRAAAAPFRRIARAGASIGGGLWRLIERLNLDGVFLWLAWLTQPVWRPIAALGGFLYAWTSTRDYRGMLWGIPAVVLLMPVIGAAAWGYFSGGGSVAEQYKLAVKQAAEAKDFETVQLFQQKLEALGVNTQVTDYNTAEALAKEGKVLDAYERMQRLAPAGEPGFVKAHVWIIQHLLARDLKLSPEETHRLLGVHLDQLKALGVDGPQIQLLRALWLAEEQKLVEAVDVLKPLVHRLPEAAMQRMSFELALQNLEEAKNDARALRTHFEERRRRLGGPGAAGDSKQVDEGKPASEKFTAEEYRWWAVAEDLVGDAASRAAVIDAWHADFPDDALVQKALAERARRAVDEQLLAAKPDAKRIVQNIIRAAELGGDPAQIHRQVAQIYQQRKQSPVAQAALEELKKSADTPETVLQLLGSFAIVSGEPVEAAELLKRAVGMNPQDAVAWNNYACSLLELPEGDVHEALKAVNAALTLAPEAPQFHETRGQVFLRLKEWSKAAEDLELAINGMPDSKSVHRSLAEAYAALGQEDLAAVHREQSK